MRKLTIEEVRFQAKKFGNWIILEDHYEDAYAKLNCQCTKCGYKTQFTWQSIRKNVRCKKCNKALKLEFIRAEFAKEDYELLTKTYDNAHQKLKYICSSPEKHKHSVTWGNWKCNERRCPECSMIKKAEKLRFDIEFIRAEFAKEGYILLTEIYENNTQKLEYICPIGHKHYVTWNKWNSKEKRRCPFCNGTAKLKIEFIRAEFAKEGYILLTKVYKNNKQRLDYICTKGHKHFISWANWDCKKKYRCPYCNNNGVSKWEKTVKSFFSESIIDYVPNDRTQLVNPETGCTLELDIWMPKLNKAIECNGLYWHSKDERKKYDKIKKQLCKDQGIGLLVITDKEWKEDIDKCKAKLISFVKTEAKHVA